MTTMNQGFDIEALVADMKPVRRMRPIDGAGIALAMSVLIAGLIVATLGLRADIRAFHPDAMVLLRSGALLLLGVATLSALVASVQPFVGQRNDGWRWALAAAMLFPVVSVMLLLAGDPMPISEVMQTSGRDCLIISSLSATAIGGALVLWMRRGAITHLARAGWLTGLSAGAFGTFAYSLHCPSESVHYIAVWYTLAMLICALLGRFAVPRLIRW